MALILIKEDGTGKPDANSYAAAADGDAYHEGHLYASAWTAATLANKEAALVMATRLINVEFQFHGFRRTSTQALEWPREKCPDRDKARNGGFVSFGPYVDSDKVPKAAVEATCEMARELLITDRTAAPVGEGLTLQRNTDQSEVIFNKRDRRPVVTCLAQSMLSRFGAPVRKAGVVLVRA